MSYPYYTTTTNAGSVNNTDTSALSAQLAQVSSALNNAASSPAVSSSLSSVSANLFDVSASVIQVRSIAGQISASLIASEGVISSLSSNLSTTSSSLSNLSAAIASVSNGTLSLSSISGNLSGVSSSLTTTSSNLSSISSNLISVSSTVLKLEQDAEISLFMRGMIPNDRTAAVITSNTAILQAAVDEAWFTGKKITGLRGIYSVNQVIYKGAFQITGSHIFKTGFQAELAGQPIFKASNDCQSTIGMLFENFIARGLGRDSSNYEGFFEGRTQKVLTQNEGGVATSAANRGTNFKNIAAIDFSGYAVTLTDSFNCHFEDCYLIYNGKSPTGAFTSTATPIYADGGIGSLGGAVRLKMQNWGDVSTTGLTFTNCYLGGNNIHVFGGKINQDQAIGVKFTKTIFEAANYGFYGARSKDITFDNCYFEGHLIKAVKCGSARFIDCYQFPTHAEDTDGFDCYGLMLHASSLEKIVYDAKTIWEVQHNDTYQHISQAIFKSGALKVGDFGDVRIYKSEVDPEGNIVASIGSLCINDTATTADKIISIKLTGTGNTGWVALSKDTAIKTVVMQPINNASYTVLKNKETHIFLDSFTKVQTYTFILPTNPTDGDKIYIHTKTGGGVNQLIINAGANGIYGMPLGIGSDEVIGLICNGNDPSWYTDRNISTNSSLALVSGNLSNVSASLQSFKTANLSNQAVNGNIPLANIDDFNGTKITQTTGGVILGLPTPTTATKERIFYVENSNSSTVPINVFGVDIPINTVQYYFWNGFVWVKSASAQTNSNGALSAVSSNLSNVSSGLSSVSSSLSLLSSTVTAGLSNLSGSLSSVSSSLIVVSSGLSNVSSSVTVISSSLSNVSSSLNLLKPIEQLHTTGATVTLANQTHRLIVNPAAILPALNITLNITNDLKRLDIVFGGTIAVGQEVVTALTITAPAGTTLMQFQALTKAFSGNTLSFIYNLTTNTFTRLF